MAIVTRTYFDSAEYTATYDFDDELLKLQAVHVDNRLGEDVHFDILFSADDSLFTEVDAPPGQTSIDLPINQQPDVVLDDRGRVTNIYARTV